MLPSGGIRVENGMEFDSLSGAADKLTGVSTNGWTFWRVARADGTRELRQIREEYLALKSAD